MSTDPLLLSVLDKLVRRPGATRRWFFYNGQCVAFARVK